jgi:predicted nucleotidyltransferase
LTNKIIQFYKDEIIALYLYGSYAVGDEIEKFSNYNLLLILKNFKANKELHLKHPPFIFTYDEIISSADTFPIEILDIKERGKILYGEDVLSKIEIKDEDLKLQVERELKEKLINFRRLLIHKKDLSFDIVRIYKSLSSVLRAILHLKKAYKPLKRINIYYEISRIYHFDYGLFLKIEDSLKSENFKYLQELKFTFYHFLETLSNIWK